LRSDGQTKQSEKGKDGEREMTAISERRLQEQFHGLRTYLNKIFRRVFGLFWPIFDQNARSCIDRKYTAPRILIENSLKRTEKSTETFY